MQKRPQRRMQIQEQALRESGGKHKPEAGHQKEYLDIGIEGEDNGAEKKDKKAE